MEQPLARSNGSGMWDVGCRYRAESISTVRDTRRNSGLVSRNRINIDTSCMMSGDGRLHFLINRSLTICGISAKLSLAGFTRGNVQTSKDFVLVMFQQLRQIVWTKINKILSLKKISVQRYKKIIFFVLFN